MVSTKKELASGVFYTGVAKYSNIAVQVVVSVILARLLTPDDYGIVAIATVFIVFFNLLSDIGIGPAVIQFKDLTKYDLIHIFSFTVYVGIIMSLLFFSSSWFIARYYNNGKLISVCQLLSLTILFHCFNIVPQNLQYKRKRFKFTALVTLLVQFCSAIAAIGLAIMGFGVYALVIQQILSIVLLFFSFYFQDRLRFEPLIDIQPLKKIMSFSVYQFLFNIINYFARNLDKLLIGRFIGFPSLGQYEKSYRLMLMPLQNISFVVTPVLQPIFSNYQNNRYEIAVKYIKLFTFLCYIGFPLSVLLFFIGRELILLLFGGQWNDAIFPFRMLALSVGFQILNGTSGSIYQSANATKLLFVSGCWCAFFMLTSFTITIIGWGTIEAVAIGYTIAQLFNSAQTYYLLFKTLQYPLRKVLSKMVYPLFVTIVIGGALLIVYPYCDSIPLTLSLIVKCTLSLIVWYIFVNNMGPYNGKINLIIKNIHRKVCQRS